MQTFLPYEDFNETAKCLDNKRLGKQRVEGMQLLNTLLNGGGWSNHPAARQWKGHTGYLLHYIYAMCMEWQRRGYKNEALSLFLDGFKAELQKPLSSYSRPPWLGDKRLHDSHKSRLLQKDPSFYGQYKWDIDPKLPYYWPNP